MTQRRVIFLASTTSKGCGEQQRKRCLTRRVRYPCAMAPTINTTKLVATAIATFVSTDKFIKMFSLQLWWPPR